MQNYFAFFKYIIKSKLKKEPRSISRFKTTPESKDLPSHLLEEIDSPRVLIYSPNLAHTAHLDASLQTVKIYSYIQILTIDLDGTFLFLNNTKTSSTGIDDKCYTSLISWISYYGYVSMELALNLNDVSELFLLMDWNDWIFYDKRVPRIFHDCMASTRSQTIHKYNTTAYDDLTWIIIAIIDAIIRENCNTSVYTTARIPP